MASKTKVLPPDPAYWIDLDAIEVWPDNYNEGDVGMIAQSIYRFGFNQAPRLWKFNQARAGNHSVMALRAVREGGPREGLPWPPEHVMEVEGKWYIRYIDIAYLNETEATGFAIADNRAAQRATQDEKLLLEYLNALRTDDPSVYEASGYDDDDLTYLEQVMQGFSQDGGRSSDGSLLAATDVTIAEPRHGVEVGDVWQVGKHILVCADVFTEWEQWVIFLKGEGVIFAPYPGPFIPISDKAETHTFIMVQPDPYVAGHILDRYADLHGESSIVRHD